MSVAHQFLSTIEEIQILEGEEFITRSEQYKHMNAVHREAMDAAKGYKSQLDDLKDGLVEMTGGLKSEGNGLKITPVEVSPQVDWKALYADICRQYPGVAEAFDYREYTKQSRSYWKITVS